MVKKVFFKFFIGHKGNNGIRPFYIKVCQRSGYVKYFGIRGKNMFDCMFLSCVTDRHLLDRNRGDI